jgi:hypothetical protein
MYNHSDPMKSATILLVALAASASAAPDCDRTCLTGLITQYLTSMVNHDPGALPVVKARFTEDTVEMLPANSPLWKNISRLGSYRQDILDVRQGVAASQVIVEEAGSPVLLVLRLQVENKKIVGIETQVTRTQKEGGLFNLKGLEHPGAAMGQMPAKSKLNSRADAIKIAELYPAGLKIGDFVATNTPFASDGYRNENGVITAGKGCTRAGCEDMQKQKIMKHPAITTRVIAVDEDQGIVLLRMNFGDTGSYGPDNALIVWEAFKIYGSQIHAIEAFMKIMPANLGSGWD